MGASKEYRPVLPLSFAFDPSVLQSTAPSSALNPSGIISFASTSTGAPVVYDLAAPPAPGKLFGVHLASIGSSSNAPVHVNAGAGVGLGTSSEDMLTLASAGDGALFVGLSTSRWACLGSHGATFSTST